MNLFFIDNGLYRKLTQTGSEPSYAQFYKSLPPEYQGISYRIIFTGLSLFEAVGLGKIKEKTEILKRIPLPNLDSNEQILAAPSKIYDAATLLLREHADLQKESIINRIKIQYSSYSTSSATADLIEKTLIQQHRLLEENPDYIKILIHELAWDVTCCFSYFNLAEMNQQERDLITPKVTLLYHALCHLWYTLQRDLNLELCSYRITNQRFTAHTFSSDYRQTVEFEKINTIKLIAELDPKHDLSDAEMIHFVTLGKRQFDNKNYDPVVAFTCEKEPVIKDRVVQQLHNIKQPFSKIEGIELSIIPGTIFFADENCKIIKKVNVSDWSNEKGLSGTVNHS